jgi:hypothetical protein
MAFTVCNNIYLFQEGKMSVLLSELFQLYMKKKSKNYEKSQEPAVHHVTGTYFTCSSILTGLSLQSLASIKGIVSPDWKGLQMVSLDRFEV